MAVARAEEKGSITARAAVARFFLTKHALFKPSVRSDGGPSSNEKRKVAIPLLQAVHQSSIADALGVASGWPGG